MTRREERRVAVRRRRVVALGAVAVVVVVGAGAVVALTGGHDGRLDVAAAYARAWSRGDYAAMYARLDDDARSHLSEARFAALHRQAAATATAVRLVAGRATTDGPGDVRVPVAVATRAFGTVRTALVLPLDGDGDHAGVRWRRSLAFPGMPDGATLTATTTLPPRASLLARDGSVLAAGTSRAPATAVADVAAQTVGQVGPVPADRAAALGAQGVPDDALVGLTGLERALDDRLRGRPGGTLSAGRRVLATRPPRPAAPVRTTIAPSVERAAIGALAGRLGGVVALDPRTGGVLAFAGIAFSGLQPPGSTFKLVTLTAALAGGKARPSDRFPVQTAATLEGVQLDNANGESCGGTLVQAFADSCNSVFAPLGVKVGATALVAQAERFGFNRAPDLAGAATPTIPAAGQIGDDLALGSSAIGQGRVQATALTMGTVAATIAERGLVPHLTLALDETRDRARSDAPVRRATDARTARQVERAMLAVVRSGTGVAAAIPGVRVAGKTGTAELQTTKRCDPSSDPTAPAGTCAPSTQDDPSDTDAWFAAYAPAGAGKARVAVGVMLVKAGAGAQTAAPAAKLVLQAALRRG